MPEYRCRRIPQSFIAGREITRDLAPLEFLRCYSQLKHILSTVESDIQDLMYFRGWREYGASSDPKCRMRKVFPSGAIVETSARSAREIEDMICSILHAQTAKAPPAPPAPAAVAVGRKVNVDPTGQKAGCGFPSLALDCGTADHAKNDEPTGF